MSETVIIKKTVKAQRWESADSPLPDGSFLCEPEVSWSEGRELVYFKYADLRPTHWLGVGKLKEETGGIRYCCTDGEVYYREFLPFAFYSVKSEASAKRDWRAVFLSKAAEEMPILNILWLDYQLAERWPIPLPVYAEYRLTAGEYGRGYKPIYFKPGDWLVFEGREPKVFSTEQFEAMRLDGKAD
jgi:hypothetical protein